MKLTPSSPHPRPCSADEFRDRHTSLNQTPTQADPLVDWTVHPRKMPVLKQPYRKLPTGDDDKIPLRQYVDEPSSDEDDLGSLTDSREHKSRKVAAARAHGQSEADGGSRRPWQRLCCGLHFSNTCLVIALIGVAAVISLGGGGLWLYKSPPKDGQSPPWYPTPQGGTIESWQKSYDKAKQMVERMTLLEKVNITTGTG
jgi:hypothetical protein